MLTRALKIDVNRKRVQKIFRKLGYIVPSKTKREIIRSKDKNVKTSRPNEIWGEVDLTCIYCGIDGWGYLFNVFDIYTREWVSYCFDLSAIKENAIISVENALVSHRTDTRTANYKSRQWFAVHKQSLPKINVNFRIKDRTYYCKHSRTKWSYRVFS